MRCNRNGLNYELRIIVAEVIFIIYVLRIYSEERTSQYAYVI